MSQRSRKWDLEASFVHKDTGIDCIGSLQDLELLIRIEWRRAEFESREIDCADEHRTVDRRSSVGERAQPKLILWSEAACMGSVIVVVDDAGSK